MQKTIGNHVSHNKFAQTVQNLSIYKTCVAAIWPFCSFVHFQQTIPEVVQLDCVRGYTWYIYVRDHVMMHEHDA